MKPLKNPASNKAKSRLDVNLLQAGIMQAFEQAEQVKNEEVVLVIGNTGSGKSTSINYLLGCKMVPADEDDLDLQAVPAKGEKVYSKVGDGHVSTTLFPVLAKNNDERQVISYCDCPGFFDNRGDEVQISTAVATIATIQNARRIRGIMVVIDYNALSVGLGSLFKELLMTLEYLLQDPAAVMPSIQFVFSKCNVDKPLDVKKVAILKKLQKMYDSLEAQIKQRQSGGILATIRNFVVGSSAESSAEVNDASELSEDVQKLAAQQRLLFLIISNPDNIHVIDVFDEGKVSRPLITSRLQAVNPIRKDTFKIAGYNEFARLELNRLMAQLAVDALEMLTKMIDLPRVIEHKQGHLQELTKQIDATRALIEKLEKSTPEDKSVILQNLQHMIATHQSTILQHQKYLADLTLSKGSLEQELGQLNSEDLVVYSEQKISDRRAPLIGVFTRTRRNINYNDIPFDKVELSCNNGQFAEAKNDAVSGSYQAQYLSTRGKDAEASVKFLVQKRNLPGNQARIGVLQAEIRRKQSEISSVETLVANENSAKSSLTGQVSAINNNIEKFNLEKSTQLRSYRAEVTSYEDNAKRTNRELTAKTRELSETTVEYQQQSPTLAMVEQMTDLLSLQSDLIDQFKLQYRHVSREFNRQASAEQQAQPEKFAF